jgi:hypothetical protein
MGFLSAAEGDAESLLLHETSEILMKGGPPRSPASLGINPRGLPFFPCTFLACWGRKDRNSTSKVYWSAFLSISFVAKGSAFRDVPSHLEASASTCSELGESESYINRNNFIKEMNRCAIDASIRAFLSFICSTLAREDDWRWKNKTEAFKTFKFLSINKRLVRYRLHCYKKTFV